MNLTDYQAKYIAHELTHCASLFDTMDNGLSTKKSGVWPNV